MATNIPNPELCCACQSPNIFETIENEDLVYGVERKVSLPIQVPVINCPDCELAFTDWRAEDIRAKAINDHLTNKL